MKYFSLFTGVGGFEIGIENAYAGFRDRSDNRGGTATERKLPAETEGITSSDSQGDFDHRQPAPVVSCVGQSEIDKHASAVLKYRFPNVRNYGDITKIDWSDVPDFDLLVGGSPCQDFSIAGKRAGLAGARSGLFGEYVRALDEKKPQHFIWENVKGVLSSNGGRDFAAILLAFSEAGYSLTWQVLNAKDFGVPQNRERVFIVGTREEGGREIFFERRNDKIRPESDAIEKEIHDVASTQTARQYASWEGNHVVSQSGRLNDVEGINSTLQAGGGGQGAKTGLILNGERVRRLTPKECERLMSWPDDWTRWGYFGAIEAKEISDTQRYKMCGNGVVSKVVEEIVYHLL